MPLELKRGAHQITSVETWFQFAPPLGRDLHWRDGQSAKELAKAWCADGQPPAPPAELLALLQTVPDLAQLTFEVGYPEHRIAFDLVRGGPRNTDLAIQCSGPIGGVALSIEGKSTEPFGRTVGDEIVAAASRWAFDEEPGKLDRVRQLAELILPRLRPGQAPLAEIRYQILTAIAGAWAFAAQSGAATAVLVVHEFLRPNAPAGRVEQNGRDLDRVVRRITRGDVEQIVPGQMVGPLMVPAGAAWPGVTTWYLGKCRTLLPEPQH